MNIEQINERFEFLMLVQADQRFTLPEEKPGHFDSLEFHSIEEIHGNLEVFMRDKETNAVYSIDVRNQPDDVIRDSILSTVEKILKEEREKLM